MAPKAGLEILDVPKIRQSERTGSLVGFIGSTFRDDDLFLGLALVSAVEGVALPIVKSLRALFGEYVPPNGEGPFTSDEIEHLDLHIALEVEHAAESSDIYERVTLSSSSMKKLTSTAATLYQRFGSFWEQFHTASPAPNRSTR